MPHLEVQSVRPKKEYTNKYGKTMYPFTIMGLLDGQLDSVDMQFISPENAPSNGEKIEVTVEEGQYGKKAKKVLPGGFTGGSHRGDPDTQMQIMRQNALTNAVAFVRDHAALLPKTKQLEFHTTDNILLAALKFVKFSSEGYSPMIKRETVDQVSPDFEPDEGYADVDQYVEGEE